MAYNSIARATGLYTPGEFDLGRHNPELVQVEYPYCDGPLDSPDAFYEYAIEMTRSDNLYRDVSQDRNNPFENRVRYNLLADLSTGEGPRSSVKDLLPSTELLQEVGPPKHEQRPNFDGLRNKLYNASKKRLSKYENMTNDVESPIRRDIVRYMWNTNPRMRGQISLAPTDNGYTYLQNHTAQNMSFNDKLISSIQMDGHIVENLEHKNSMYKKDTSSPKKLIPDYGIIQLSQGDNAMKLDMRKTKQHYTGNKFDPRNIQHDTQINSNERTYRTSKNRSKYLMSQSKNPQNMKNNTRGCENFVGSDSGQVLNNHSRTKIQTKKLESGTQFDSPNIPQNDKQNNIYSKSYDNRVGPSSRGSRVQADLTNNYETYEMGYKKPKIETSHLRNTQNTENINIKPESDRMPGRQNIHKKSGHIMVGSKQESNIQVEDNIITHKVLKHG